MGFFKRQQKKINKKWYPQSITVGKPVSTDEVARRISAECTVNPADTFAVLKSLGGILGDFMANGRTVKLDGLGTFYYTAASNGNGVETADKVNATQITGVRVRFIPETHQNSSHQVTTRSLVYTNIFWEEWGGKDSSIFHRWQRQPGEVCENSFWKVLPRSQEKFLKMRLLINRKYIPLFYGYNNVGSANEKFCSY